MPVPNEGKGLWAEELELPNQQGKPLVTGAQQQQQGPQAFRCVLTVMVWKSTTDSCLQNKLGLSQGLPLLSGLTALCRRSLLG